MREALVEGRCGRALFRRVRTALVGIVVMTGVTPAVLGQFRASIQGTVSDPSGAAIPGASLVLLDTDTNNARTATSNASGVYNFNALPPDHYKLTAKAPGFKEQVISDVRLTPEQANAVNVQLALGDASVTVNVNGDQTPALETETATISGTVTDNQVQHMPSAGRDVFQLMQLAPGVFGDGSQGAGGGTNNLPGNAGPGGTASGAGIFQTENQPQTLANGGQSQNNGISIDGISTVSAVWGGASVVTPTEDSVGSVRIVSNNYDAEDGRFSGAQVQVTSKTGTNDFHGSLFFRANRPGLNAYQPYNGPGSLTGGSPASRGLNRDEQDFNQFGGSVGGPIWKNRLFAFFAYETIRNSANQTTQAWYDTSAFDGLGPTGSISQQFLTFPGCRGGIVGPGERDLRERGPDGRCELPDGRGAGIECRIAPDFRAGEAGSDLGEPC